MKHARLIGAVLLGYVLAALANSAWVVYWYVNIDPAISPRETPVTLTMLGATALMFAATGLIVGVLLRLVAGPARRNAALITAALLAAVGVVNIVLGMAVEPIWHTALAIAVQAPAVILGSRLGS